MALLEALYVNVARKVQDDIQPGEFIERDGV